MDNQNDTIPPVIVSTQSGDIVPTPVVEKEKSSQTDLIKNIALIGAGAIAVIFIGLFIWMYIQYNESKTNIDGKIDEAVAKAVDENTTKLNTEFADREKNPYKAFAGPANYGELSFSYPKTWNVYENKDANDGKNYEAYFNPDKVTPIGKTTINAMRVSIYNTPLESVIADYNKSVEKGEVSASAMQINGENANVYEGHITKELVGRAVVFGIRDKTVVMQTDASIFYEDFEKVLATVSFNK